MRTPKTPSSLEMIPETSKESGYNVIERLEESAVEISPISRNTPIKEEAPLSSPSSSIRPDDEVIPSRPTEDWTSELEIEPQDVSPSPQQNNVEEDPVVSGVARRRALRRRTREAAVREGNLGGIVLPTPVHAVVKIQSAWRSRCYINHIYHPVYKAHLLPQDCP